MADLAQLIAQPEGQYFDRKSLWHGPADQRRPRDRRQVRDQIARYVAAFANADGGTLVLGVEDDGAPSGHRYPEDVVDAFLSVPTHRLKPPQEPGRRERVQDHELLVFRVASAPQAVMVTGDGFPRRAHDTVTEESEEAINAIKRRGLLESVEVEPVSGVTIDDLDAALLRQAMVGAGLDGSDPREYLLDRRLADERGSDLVLRKGAVLLFAARARQIDHPTAGIRVFRVDGTVRETGPRLNVREILPRLEGSLPGVLERAYETVGGLIKRSHRLHDLFFRETPEYPTFAWQEALVNAVAHRDYRNQHQWVDVYLYDDRLEVHSPGGLVLEVDVERLRRREPIHAARNPRITRVLTELALMREQGEGIPRMFEEMERSWLRLPELRTEERSFVVVLHNEPILQAPEPEWVGHVRALPLSNRQRRILVAYPRGEFGSGEYQQLNLVDRDIAYRDLKDLVARGLVTPPKGAGRGAKYRVTDSARATVRPLPESATPEAALAAVMEAQGSVQNADYRDCFDVDRHEATTELARLTARGILVKEGERRGTRYRPGPAWDEWAKAAQFER
jgi:ATP-dependent DNA helicase RecG